MKKIIFPLVFGFGMATNALAIEGNVEAGQTKSAACIACHGADGNSPVPMYPKLAGQSAQYIAKQLADFKLASTTGGKEGRNDPIMSGMVMGLSEQDMADIAAYFSSNAISAGNGSAYDAGHKLYFGGDAERGISACVACHSADGKGMANASFPAVAGQNVDYLKGQLEKFRSGARANDNGGMMQAIAIKLSDKDNAALTQYMSSIK